MGTGYAGPFIGRLGGQTYVLVVACLCIIITFIILMVYLFGFHTTIMEACPWRITVSGTRRRNVESITCRVVLLQDLIYSIMAVILYFIAGIVESWYASGAWEQGTLLPKWWTQSSWACRNLGPDTAQYQCPIYIPWVIAAVS